MYLLADSLLAGFSCALIIVLMFSILRDRWMAPPIAEFLLIGPIPFFLLAVAAVLQDVLRRRRSTRIGAKIDDPNSGDGQSGDML